MAIEYKVKNDIATMITKSEGTVFGGYVRDFILHDYYANKFYSTHKSEDYTDPSVSPETIDRLVIPKDIDCHFKNIQNYSNFKELVLKDGYTYSEKRVKGFYIEDDEQVIHYKLQIIVPNDERYILRKIKLPFFIKKQIKISTERLDINPIYIDILLHSDIDPPFMGLDFECNGLVMDKNGIRLCKSLTSSLFPVGNYRNFQRIVSDIHKKKAIACNIKTDRWKKMIERKWNVHGPTIQRNVIEGNSCVLCHEIIDKFDNYNLVCCAASYHEKCLSKIIREFMLDRNQCCHCRQTCFFQDNEILSYNI